MAHQDVVMMNKGMGFWDLAVEGGGYLLQQKRYKEAIARAIRYTLDSGGQVNFVGTPWNRPLIPTKFPVGQPVKHVKKEPKTLRYGYVVKPWLQADAPPHKLLVRFDEGITEYISIFNLRPVDVLELLFSELNLTK